MKPRLRLVGSLWRASYSRTLRAYGTTPLEAQLRLEMLCHQLVAEYRGSRVDRSLPSSLEWEDWERIWWNRETEIEAARLAAEQRDQLSPSPEHSATSGTLLRLHSSAPGPRTVSGSMLDTGQLPGCTQTTQPLPVAFRLVPGTAGNTLADMLGIVGLIAQKPERDSNGSET